MGLDIYLHKVKVQDESKNEFKAEGFENANEVMTADYKVELKKALEKAVKYLNKNKGADNYKELYEKKVKSLFKYFNYPEFYLGDFGLTYDYASGEYSIKVVDELPTEAVIEKMVKKGYAPSIAYWRKVNFIYAYFDNKGAIDHDSECAWVDEFDLKDIIARCEKVLKAKNTATNIDILPTQGGFFFGSLEYDEYYYGDVKDTIKQLKKVVRGLKDDEQCFMVFSW